MRSFDYEAVVYDCEVFCVECIPDGVSLEDDCYPIFADSEWDYAPVCCNCGEVHDYMTILNEEL